MKPILSGLTLAATLLLGHVALAATEVTERIQSGALSFTGGQGFTNAVLMITGPNDYEREETASRGLPVFRAQNSGRLVDGIYQYSLSAATDEKETIKNPVDNGRGTAARDYVMKPFSMYGSFTVKKGSILPAEAGAEGADGDAKE